MKGLTDSHKASSRFLVVAILLLILLVGIASYVWTAPQRAERALKQASLSELQAETQRNPNHARAFYYLGLRLQQAGQLGPAQDAFAHAAQLDADDEQSWLATAALSSQLYGDQGAFDLLGIYIKRHPESAQAHLALARLYRKKMSHRRAREEALAAAKWNPHLAEAWYIAGLSANSLGSVPEAEAALRQAMAQAPQDWRYPMILGDILVQEKRSQEAIGYEQEAIRMAPNESVTYLSLGRAQLEMATSPAEIETARQSLQHSAALQPDMPMPYMLIGQSYARQARWQEAKEAFGHAARFDPTDPEPVFELARIYRRLGDIAAADRFAQRHNQLLVFVSQRQTLKEKLVVTKGDMSALRLELARLCAKNGDIPEAIEQYHRYLETHPDAQDVKLDLAKLESRTATIAQASYPVLASGTSGPTNNAAALLPQADALYTQKHYAEAERAYTRVLKEDKQSAPACQGLGLTLAAEGKQEKALMYLLSAVKLDPNLAPAQYALAHAYMDMEAPAEARRRMLKVVQLVPDNADYWHLLGMACSPAEPYYAQAEDALRHAVMLNPHNAQYLLDLADMLVKTEKQAEAETTYRQALALAPDDTDTEARVGMFLLSGRPTPQRQQEAEKLLRKVLQTSPNDSYTLYALGQLRLEQGDARQAATYLQRAIAYSTQIDTAELWYLLARAYERLGEQSQAAKALTVSRKLREEYQTMRHAEETVNQHPHDLSLRLKLARIHARRGENAKAIDTYQACLRLDPHNAQARAELAALEKQLQAGGKMPPMLAFRALVAAAGQTH
jgi:tetratricopeptide (TPR) repeat protein